MYLYLLSRKSKSQYLEKNIFWTILIRQLNKNDMGRMTYEVGDCVVHDGQRTTIVEFEESVGYYLYVLETGAKVAEWDLLPCDNNPIDSIDSE